MAGIFILCLIASGVNPSAYRIYAFPLGTLSSPAIQRYITEWFSPNFHEVDWVPLALLLLGIMALGLFVRRRFKFTTIGLLTVSAYASLRTVRNVPLFSVIAAPVMASQLSSIVTLQPSTENIPRRTRMTLAILLAVIALVGAALVWLRLSDQPKTDRATFPVGAVDWIEIHQPEGNLFNAYQWGGYLIWRLYPHYPVFIDGRAELHGDQMLTEYVNIYNTHSGWEQDLEHYGVGSCWWSPTRSLLSA